MNLPTNPVPLDLEAIRESFVENGNIDARVVALIAEIRSLREANDRMAEGIQRWVQSFQALVPEEAKARVDTEILGLREEVTRLKGYISRYQDAFSRPAPEARYNGETK